MALPNIFTKPVADEIVRRINRLEPTSKANWGKMNVAQMLAHCNVTYEMVYENIHPRPGFLMRLMLKSFVKKSVVGEGPYKRNSQTAPAFIIKGDRNFEVERKRLIGYIEKTQQLGESHFNNRESASFGVLGKEEWNNMFYKHLAHHLSQFEKI